MSISEFLCLFFFLSLCLALVREEFGRKVGGLGKELFFSGVFTPEFLVEPVLIFLQSSYMLFQFSVLLTQSDDFIKDALK